MSSDLANLRKRCVTTDRTYCPKGHQIPSALSPLCLKEAARLKEIKSDSLLPLGSPGLTRDLDVKCTTYMVVPRSTAGNRDLKCDSTKISSWKARVIQKHYWKTKHLHLSSMVSTTAYPDLNLKSVYWFSYFCLQKRTPNGLTFVSDLYSFIPA